MKAYECLFILPPDAPEAKKKQSETLEDLVKKAGGKVTQKTDLGKKPLGYLIKKNRDGEFLLWIVDLDPSKVAEFRRSLELQEELLSYMITVKGEDAPVVSSAPAAKPAEQASPASQS